MIKTFILSQSSTYRATSYPGYESEDQDPGYEVAYRAAKVPTPRRASYIDDDIPFQDDRTCARATEPNEEVWQNSRKIL